MLYGFCRNDVFVAYEGEFDAVRYVEAFAKFTEASDVFVTPLLFAGEKILVEEVTFLQTFFRNTVCSLMVWATGVYHPA